jgi:hypothetical protein
MATMLKKTAEPLTHAVMPMLRILTAKALASYGPAGKSSGLRAAGNWVVVCASVIVLSKCLGATSEFGSTAVCRALTIPICAGAPKISI